MKQKSKLEILIEQLKLDGCDSLAAKILSIRKVVAPSLTDDEYFMSVKNIYYEYKRDTVN